MSDTRPSLALKLVYRHGLGDLTYYFEALGEGRAIGARCPDCGRVWCPPRRWCPEHDKETEPVELSGAGTVAAVTETTTALPFTEDVEAHRFVLVTLDGADNLIFGRMSADSAVVDVGSRVRLRAPRDPLPHPAQAVIFAMEDEG